MSLLHTFLKLITTCSFSGLPLFAFALLNALLHYVLANLTNASANTSAAFGIKAFLFDHFSLFFVLSNILLYLLLIYSFAKSFADVTV